MDPANFFLPCDPDSRYFYRVEIYRTARQMRKAIDELKGPEPKSAPKDEAVCLRYEVKESAAPAELRKCHCLLGTIFFYRDNMPIGTVVHELTHAAVGWAKKTKTNPMKFTQNYETCPEECFARTLQYLVEQFYLRAPRALS